MRVLVILVVTGLCAGCASSLTPLYRDFEIEPSKTPAATAINADVYDRIERALNEAGWQMISGQAENVVTTDSRQFRNWGIYSIKVSLDVVPLNDEFVRLYIHPYRHYFTGSRSKLGFLSKGLGRSFLPNLREAFANEGLYPVGTHIERDEEMTGERPS